MHCLCDTITLPGSRLREELLYIEFQSCAQPIVHALFFYNLQHKEGSPHAVTETLHLTYPEL
jgi:hypothetical protein